MATIFKLLKPGGALSFAESNMLNPQVALQKNISWIKKAVGDSPNETAFFRWRINELLCQAEFVDIQITPFDWLHPATPPKLIHVVEKAGLFFERILLVREFAGSLHIFARRPI